MSDPRANVLLFGRTGQVGSELARALSPIGEVTACGRHEADFLVPETVSRAVLRHRPDVVINAAAYTAVDRAESEPASAELVNARAVEALARAAHEVDAAVIHYSTDYVFDGEKEGAYVETDPTAPLNVYGRTKLLGERALADRVAAHVILRTSWVYGAGPRNFLRTILRLARERDELAIVDDHRGAPTASRFIAEATAAILARCGGDVRGHLRARAGVYHLTAAGAATWYRFACAIAALDPRREEQRARAIRPIPAREYPTPARRPRNSVLDNTRIARAFGVAQPAWEDDLARVMASLGGAAVTGAR